MTGVVTVCVVPLPELLLEFVPFDVDELVSVEFPELVLVPLDIDVPDEVEPWEFAPDEFVVLEPVLVLFAEEVLA